MRKSSKYGILCVVVIFQSIADNKGGVKIMKAVHCFSARLLISSGINMRPTLIPAQCRLFYDVT